MLIELVFTRHLGVEVVLPSVANEHLARGGKLDSFEHCFAHMFDEI